MMRTQINFWLFIQFKTPKTKEIVCNVFVPTTPNPTTGFLIMVPENKLVALDMSVGDAIKLIISGGTVIPQVKTAIEEKE